MFLGSLQKDSTDIMTRRPFRNFSSTMAIHFRQQIEKLDFTNDFTENRLSYDKGLRLLGVIFIFSTLRSEQDKISISKSS